ncbi:GGDEF domain-containing protein [Qiania dongpingensis]|uniref:GGDEF domain-containing protein n=1 Tax=Qiania dongpingensis TaxID=2763669 RepID=A0A7G9G3I8_9FIRM|nr:GGDEF domain-containing protein [Qiania dongpingensis]QNM05370.1 GGDEF domain-containing protein [Qiania dongpingensis]
MAFSVYIGGGLLVPAGLSLLYGFTSGRAMSALGYSVKCTDWSRLSILLPVMIIFVLWGMIDIPLPIVYILAYFGKVFQLFRNGNRTKEIFLINLTHLLTMALHMILIGTFSLAAGVPMNEILAAPLWRIAAISVVLAVNNLAAFMIPGLKMFLEVLRTQSESEEIRPFFLFLWFCNVFLLSDSILCCSRVEWNLLPLFLIGSTVLLESYLICFLDHLYSILKIHHLEDENKRLSAELLRQHAATEKWAVQSGTDPMTGIFSRRYAMEKIAFKLQSEEPFSLVFIDLDHLKQINDQKGHREGDLYLINFTRALKDLLVESDVFARVGGDEFVVLLSGCGKETAERRMEAIRFALTEKQSFSFSFGVASTPCDSIKNAEDMIHLADQAMYQDKAKENDRRRKNV